MRDRLGGCGQRSGRNQRIQGFEGPRIQAKRIFANRKETTVCNTESVEVTAVLPGRALAVGGVPQKG